MTSSLPHELLDVFEHFVTTEYVFIDAGGQPIAWPVTPYFHRGEGWIDFTTGLGYPKKADDARRNPHVAMLFSDPTGSGIDEAPMVLVQGTARVDDADVEANAQRYEREASAKLPATPGLRPPAPLRRLLGWQRKRIYVHVRPERVYTWPRGDVDTEPQLFDAHLDEVRSAHNEEPEAGHRAPEGGAQVWDPRLDRLGTLFPTAALAFVGPDGFPFAVRVPVRADAQAAVVRIEADPVGAPIEPGLACLCAHLHAQDLSWWRSFHVRGDLLEERGAWVLRPHRVVRGLDLPPGSPLRRLRIDARRTLRFAPVARGQERRRRPGAT